MFNLRLRHADCAHEAPQHGTLVKLTFKLHAASAEGWPPVAEEMLWAEPLPGDRFRIANIPFFANGVNLNDVVFAARQSPDAPLAAEDIVEHGGHASYRVVVADGLDQDRHAAFHQLLDAIREFGCEMEVATPRFFAVDVPPSANCYAVGDLLQVGADEGIWTFELGSEPSHFEMRIQDRV